MMLKTTFLMSGIMLTSLMVGRPAQAQQPPAADNQTLLKMKFGNGRVTAFVNNTNVGTFGPAYANDPNRNKTLFVDVSRFAHPGNNSLRLTWNEPIVPNGEVLVEYAEKAKRFRDLSRATWGRRDPLQGQKDMTFTLPDGKGVNGGNSKEIVKPVDEGPAIATYDNQTIMDVALNSGTATITVNGAQAGSFRAGSMGRVDITRYAHPGMNNIRVQSTSGGALNGTIKITYAPVKDKFGLRRIINWAGVNKTTDDTTFSLPTVPGAK